MKALFTAIFCIFFGANVIPAEPDKDALEKLAAHIGKTFWSPPEKRLVRATTYEKRKDGSGSRKNVSNATISLLRYATAKEAGTIAVPHWLPRGSMVKIQTQQGVYAYIASDNGGDVDNRKAAQSSGKTIEQRGATVLDFCAPKQLWPDFIIVEIYYYAGKVPFDKLSLEDQKTLFAYAMEYVTKRE